jgi:hypothetical protein
MKRILLWNSLAILCSLFTLSTQAQLIVLNEDFSTASGTDQPADWSNFPSNNSPATDLWHFDDPGNRDLPFPFTGNYAIFDADATSDNGQQETSVLVSKTIDASAGANCVLTFDHYLDLPAGASGLLEVFDGNSWETLQVFTTSTAQPTAMIFDVSSQLAGITNGRIRFTWQGNSSGFWAIDNIQVNLPATLDGGITNVTNPAQPFSEGSYPVAVNITNFGVQTITNVVIGWSLNGVIQSNVTFQPSQPLTYSQFNSNVVLANNVFFEAGEFVDVDAYIISVNGQIDQNTYNDSINKSLIAALCGSYTIGGASPRFENFEDAANVLVQAGVSCPVVFNVRPGIYNEQFYISNIPGSTYNNNITFQSESGDSSDVIVENLTLASSENFTMNLAGCSHLRFKNLSIKRNNSYIGVNILTGTRDIKFENCVLGNIRAFGATKVDSLSFVNNEMSDNYIVIGEDWHYSPAENRCHNIRIIGNSIGGIGLYNVEDCFIANNFRANAPDSLSGGIGVDNNNLHITITNNRVHGMFIEGTDFYVANNVMITPGEYALRAEGIYSSRIEHNLLSKANGATHTPIMRLYGANDIRIQGNTFLGKNLYEGIEMYYHIYIEDWQPNILSNNTFTNTVGRGIFGYEINTLLEKNTILGHRNGSAMQFLRAPSEIINNMIEVGGAGQAIGILLDSDANTANTNDNSRILHNNILVTSADPINGRAINIRKGLNLEIKNNIFSNIGGGYAAVYDEDMSSSIIGHNDYYASGLNLLKRNGNNYSSFTDYINVFASESGSLSINPFYTAIDNLSPNQIALKDNATLIADVPTDFFGIQRGNAPDIGAVEFEPCAGDLAINRFIGLSTPLPSGPNQPITVELSNQGSNLITQATISWVVNGISQTPYLWNGSLQPEGIAIVQIGTYSFETGEIYDISATTSSDCNPYNNTCGAGIVGTPLCGDYFIGGAPAPERWFPTFGAATQALTAFGIECSVVFTVADGIYEEDITLYQVEGTSSVNTITFIGESQNSNSALLTTTDNTAGNYTLTLSSSQFIYFHNIGITRPNATFAILMNNGCRQIGFENCTLGGVFRPSNTTISDLVFRNNTMIGQQIKLGEYSNALASNIIIENNTLEYIYLYNVKNGRIADNISNPNSSAEKIEVILQLTRNLIVENNELRSISMDRDSFAVIRNNNFLLSRHAHAIGAGGLTGVRISNNTINSIYPYGNFALISIGGGQNDTIQDNILNCNGTYSGIIHFNEYYYVGQNIVIERNIIENAQDFGIFTHKTIAQIRNNKIRNFKNGMAIKNMRTNDKISNNLIHCDGSTPVIGISLLTRIEEPDNQQTVEIYHNNVWIESTDNVNGVGLQITNGFNHIVKNNIFYNSNGGYAASFNYENAGSILDYNNYFTSGSNFILWNNSPISNIAGLVLSSGQESHSLSVNPNFTSETYLAPNQTLLNNSAPIISGYTTDINGVNRSSNCDFGAIEFVPCSNDRGLNSFINLEDQVQLGIIPIRVQIQNHGTSNLTTASVAWSVNGIAQNQFTWNGLISPGNNEIIQIGTYPFQPLTIYELKAWISGTDCNNQNDSCQTNQIGIPLCGNYTIGGSNPDFVNFTEASNYLNNIGVSCPVVFNVEPGTYLEQVFLNNAPGSSSINTITFQNSNGDSTSAQLYYPNQNVAYPFTLGLYGAKYFVFQNMQIDINPYGAASIRVEANSSNLTFRNSRIYGIDGTGLVGNLSNIVVENNFMTNSGVGFGRENTSGTITNCRVSNNFVNGIYFDKGRDILVEGNRNEIDPNSSSWYSQYLRSTNVTIRENRIRRVYFNLCENVVFDNNHSETYEYWNIAMDNSRNMVVKNSYFKQFPSWTYAANVNGYNNTDCIIQNNIIEGSSTYPGITWRTEPWDIQTDTIKISNNIIQNSKDYGIYIFRYNSVISGNKILNLINGPGITADGRKTDIYNNYIHCTGGSNSIGIRLPSKVLDYGPIYDYARIYHNSINIVSNNAQFGRGLEVLDNYPADIRNNIFANEGGGFAAFINSNYSNLNLDYNCYYSTASNFGSYNGTLFNNLSSWGQAVQGDANSLELDPFFETETELLPFQRQINGAGIGIDEVPLDIDGEIRNLQAPDMGAQEFMIDFGITDLLSPTLDCYQSDEVPVTIALRQFGDIPFIDLQLAYQLNNGTVYTNTIPGAIDDDIEFTFNNLVDLSQEGTYLFKIWLVDNTDDNIFNDTLFIERFRKPAPVVDFNFTSACANSAVNFTGSASISEGFIALTEWDFGDGEMAEGLTTSHIYDVSSTYDVIFRAFSNEGCYSEVTRSVNLLPTPDVSFTSQGSCINSAVNFTNLTILPAGTGSVNYTWNFGDGATSVQESPSHTYAAAGSYTISLTATNQGGCSDSFSTTIEIYDLPEVSFTLPTTYDLNLPSITLVGTPPGGTFSGPGVIGNVFAPALAGIGNHTVVYEYTNGATGCSSSATQTINIFNSLCVDPEITTQPIDYLQACINGTATLSVVASGSQLSYQWYQASSAIAQGTPIPNAVNASYSPSTSSLGSLFYYCKISFPNGCYSVTDRSEVEVIGVQNPTFSSFAQICTGETAPLLPLTSNNGYTGTWTPTIISTTSAGIFDYTFTPTAGLCASVTTINVTITPATLPLFNVDLLYCVGEAIPALPNTSTNNISGNWTPGINSATTTTYTFTPSAGQCALSTTATIVVNPVVAPVFNQIGALCAGEPAPLLFNQSLNGIDGSWSPATIDNTTSGFYTFTPDADECSNALTIFVQVNPLPNVTISGGTSLCTGEQGFVQFTGTPNATVAYFKDNGSLEFITLNALGQAQVSTGFLTQATTYTLVNASTATCLATLNGNTTFTVIPSSSAGIGSNLFLCNDIETVDLFESLGGSPTPNGTWSGPSTLSNGFYGTYQVGTNATGAYTYAVPGAANCPPSTATIFVNISSGSVTTIDYTDPFCTNLTGSQLPIINGPIGGTFTSSPAGLDISAAGGITPASSAPGTYLVVYTPLSGTGCSGGLISTQVQITSPPVAAITPSGPFDICDGESILLTATPGSNYVWSNGATTQSILVSADEDYSVVIYNGSNCSATSNTVQVNVLPIPGELIIADGPTVFCQGETVTLSASPGSQYQWSNGSTLPQVTVSIDGSYQVEVTNAFGCSTLSESVDVSVLIPNSPIITPNGIISICDNASQTLTASGGSNYFWSTNATGGSIQVTQAGPYTVTATDSQGCIATSAPVEIVVSPVPTPVITTTGGTTFCTGGSVTLTAAAADQYNWSNGATTQSIVVTQSGDYSVTLSNGNNCNATSSSITVDVADSFTFYQDIDGDGFGNPFVSEQGCTSPDGWELNGDDCNDTNAGINPNIADICDDELDNNCNQWIDEDCEGAGCTDEDACNFDSSATFNDGSCSYPGCNDPSACNFNALAGCLEEGSCITGGCDDPLACNFDNAAQCNDGSCTYAGCTNPIALNYNPLAGCDNGSCQYIVGCMDSLACNYNAQATQDNGACEYPGCTTPLACNYDPNAGCNDGSCTFSGCTDPNATNYDPAAGCNDGSCIYIEGCTDITACNYNPDAGISDGSCTYPGCTDMNACNYNPIAGCANLDLCYYLSIGGIAGEQIAFTDSTFSYFYECDPGCSVTFSMSPLLGTISPAIECATEITWINPGLTELTAAISCDNGCAGSTTLTINVEPNSVYELSVQSNISAYPNPTTLDFVLSLDASLLGSSLEVYNTLGMEVYSGVISDFNTTIQSSEWPAGIYTLQVSNENERYTLQVVKQ